MSALVDDIDVEHDLPNRCTVVRARRTLHPAPDTERIATEVAELEPDLRI